MNNTQQTINPSQEEARQRLFGNPQGLRDKKSPVPNFKLTDHELMELLMGDCLLKQTHKRKQANLIEVKSDWLTTTVSMASTFWEANLENWSMTVAKPNQTTLELMADWYQQFDTPSALSTQSKLARKLLPEAPNTVHDYLLTSNCRDELYTVTADGQLAFFPEVERLFKQILASDDSPQSCAEKLLQQILENQPCPLDPTEQAGLIQRACELTNIKRQSRIMGQMEHMQQVNPTYMIGFFRLTLTEIVTLLLGGMLEITPHPMFPPIQLQLAPKHRKAGYAVMKAYLDYLDQPGHDHGLKSWLKNELRLIVAPAFEEVPNL